MAKIIFLLFLSVAESAFGTVAKRQLCDLTNVPEECRPLLSSTIDDSAFFNQSHFIGTYCGANCAYPLFEYFRNCDIDAMNATRFDFYCASNAAGNRCIQAVLTAISYNSFTSCVDPLQGESCKSTCKHALATGYDSLGCCLFSFYAIEESLVRASAVFSRCSEEPRTLCVGGASGETLQIPPTVTVNPECEKLVKNVDESCRYLLMEVSDALFLDELCGATCGPQIYQFYVDCDEKTGVSNASAIDVFCAVNSREVTCGILFESFTQLLVDLDSVCSAIDELTCTVECRTAIQQGQAAIGCCLSSLAQHFSDDNMYTHIDAICGLDTFRNCIGHFSGKPAPPPPTKPTVGPTMSSARCTRLRNTIPETCQDVSTVESISISFFSYDGFKDTFCNSNCAKPAYEYIVECVNQTEGSYIDFLCSESLSGTDCINVLRNETVTGIDEGVCKDTSGKQCSQDCKAALNGFNREYGCCLFTYFALDTNLSYTNGLWAQCGLDNVILCTGGISNAIINAPRGSEPEKSAASATFSSTLILIFTFSLAFVL